MSRELYRKLNPYQTWSYRPDGSKFVARGRNRADVIDWAKKTHTRLGNETTAGNNRKIRKKSNEFGIRPLRLTW